MKKSFKKLFTIALIGVMSLALVSCKKKEVITPEQSLEVYLDIFIKRSDANIDKIGLSKEQFEYLLKARDKGLEEGMSNTGEVVIDEETERLVLDSINTALTKIEYTVLDADINEYVSYVNVEINSIDFEVIIEETQNEIIDNLDKYMELNEDELMKEIFILMTEKLKNPPMNGRSNIITVKMNRNDNNLWEIDENGINEIVNSLLSY